jgi:hypothetical protein
MKSVNNRKRGRSGMIDMRKRIYKLSRIKDMSGNNRLLRKMICQQTTTTIFLLFYYELLQA